MKVIYKFIITICLASLLCFTACQNTESVPINDSVDAAPWCYWYWMHGAISNTAITADLEAMKQVGMTGTYIFTIRDIADPELYPSAVKTLSPEWWQYIRFAASEAKRLDMKLGFNACDGFTCAGGPWITPEMSMQKLTWADTVVSGGRLFSAKLPQPEFLQNYYNDIAVFAYPAPPGAGMDSWKKRPVVTSSMTDDNVQYLADSDNEQLFTSTQPGWIQFAFDEPFTCRSIQIKTGWNNYQSNRLIIETSNDGVHFSRHTRLVPPRSGWQDLDADNTQLIKSVTAKYFRFVFDPAGSEPGAEDLDDAKWEPTLRLYGIGLLSEAKIHQFEGKNGSIWREAEWSDDELLSDSLCVDFEKIINISEYLEPNGTLNWQVPKGDWVILRIGHTSTGHENYIGGGGKGLECDKFDPDIVRFQFDQWFGEINRQLGVDLSNVITRFHVDSWECGSQNWSSVMRNEFKNRRGYDIVDYLPLMAGVPIDNAETSERILYDIRTTVAELFADNFYKTFHKECQNIGVLFSAESDAPVGVGDGMLHFKYTDLPMGEYWFKSPSHDKPNDILDAVSGAHIYGKKIVQAESFTELRLDWDETPAMLKPLVDRNFALGINKVVAHVFTLNPWMDRVPGMTLDRIGTYLQRDQVWWDFSYAFWNYIENCQAWLQKGDPVVDIAVFTGEEIPRRAILPDRLVDILPNIMGQGRKESERLRLANKGFPLHSMPEGVTVSTNIADPEKWIDPLNGYAYDSINRDALLNLAKVEDGKIVLPGGASYSILIVPGKRKLAPHGGERMSVEVAEKLAELVWNGASVLWMEKPQRTLSNKQIDKDKRLQDIFSALLSEHSRNDVTRLLWGPYNQETFSQLGVEKDFVAKSTNKDLKGRLAWNHRRDKDTDIYFIANQTNETFQAEMRFRVSDKVPFFYDPLDNVYIKCQSWHQVDDRIEVDYEFHPNSSVFVLFNDGTTISNTIDYLIPSQNALSITGPWTLDFDPGLGGPMKPIHFDTLQDLSINPNVDIRYYSGKVTYQSRFNWEHDITQPVWIDLGEVYNVAHVRLNGETAGVCWTLPNRLRIDKYLKPGINQLEIEVANTWHNRLIRDHSLPESERITWTSAPYRLEGKPLLKSGLLGPVSIQVVK